MRRDLYPSQQRRRASDSSIGEGTGMFLVSTESMNECEVEQSDALDRLILNLKAHTKFIQYLHEKLKKV